AGSLAFSERRTVGRCTARGRVVHGADDITESDCETTRASAIGEHVTRLSLCFSGIRFALSNSARAARICAARAENSSANGGTRREQPREQETAARDGGARPGSACGSPREAASRTRDARRHTGAREDVVEQRGITMCIGPPPGQARDDPAQFILAVLLLQKSLLRRAPGEYLRIEVLAGAVG